MGKVSSGMMEITETHFVAGATLVLMMLIFIYLFGYFGNQQKVNRDKIRKTDLKLIKAALDLYYRDNQRYPDEGANNGLLNIEGETAFCHPVGCATNSYLKTIPKDPLMGCRYVYRHLTEPAEGYVLYSTLENYDAGKGTVQAGYGMECGKTESEKCLCKYKLTN